MTKTSVIRILGALALAVFVPACHSADRPAAFSARVIGVSDGDTITVLHQGRPEKIRLWGIDCPERGQAFGSRAKDFSSKLAYGKEVRLRPRDRDKYGRTVAEVELPDGRLLNQELVKAGLAWWFRRYAEEDRTLQSLESRAQREKLGLWADGAPQPPWEYRKKGKW